MCILGNESSLFGGCKFAMSHQSGPPLTSSDCWQSPPSLSETAFRPRAQFSPGAKLCIACLSATTRAAPAPIYASAHPLMSGELFTAALIWEIPCPMHFSKPTQHPEFQIWETTWPMHTQCTLAHNPGCEVASLESWHRRRPWVICSTDGGLGQKTFT